MNTVVKQELKWEKLSDGSIASLHGYRPEIKRAGTALQNVAIAKMTDVAVISASFGEEQLVFEPWISVLLDSGDDVLFYGAYTLSYPVEDAQKSLPSICIRSCSWSKNKDFPQFEKAENKADYCWSDSQVQSTINFGLSSACRQFTTSASDLFALIDKGIKRREVQRPDFVWRNISVDVISDCYQWRYAYSPLVSAVDGLESWLEMWQTTFKNMVQDDVKPMDCKISYRPSLIERIPRK